MLKRKQAGLPPPKERVSPHAPNVINLMDALRRSLGEKAPAARKAPVKKARKRIEGQKEMLLPISGKKEKEAAKPAARPAARRKKAG